MADEQAVNTTESAPVENVIQEVVKETAPETTQQEQTQVAPPVTQAPAPTVSDVDEFGVPWKNRAMEWKRKNEEVIEKLPQMVEEKLSNFSQQGQRKYTVEELEQFSLTTDNPAYSAWAKGEIRKIEREENAKVVREEIGNWKKEQTNEVKKGQAFNYVAQNYPEAFVKNQAGQVIGFNQTNPLFQQIDQLMRDPRFANDPEGLIAAADIAWARQQRSQQPVIQKQLEKQKEEFKNLQRSTLVEGGSRTTTSATPPHRAALDRAKQTGSMRDAQAALKAILDAKRQSEERE